MSEVAPRQDRTLEDIADVWDLTPHELDRLAAERHINAYVDAGLRVIGARGYPRSRGAAVRLAAPSGFGETFDRAVDALLALEPSPSGVDLTQRVFDVYAALPALSAGDIPALTRLLAALAYIPLRAEREGGPALWWHPPVRPLSSEHRTVLQLVERRFCLDDVWSRFERQLLGRGARRDDPVSLLFAAVILLVAALIVALENGIEHERVLAGFLNVEAAMRDYEARHSLGSAPGLELDVADPGQLRYRNTLYLYGGNLLERMGRLEQARRFYLRDIEHHEQLPRLLGFYMTALKTCERLMSAYHVDERHPRAKATLLALTRSALAKSYDQARKYAVELGEVRRAHPQLDWSQPKLDVGGKTYLCAGEACREPLLAALLYRQMVEGVPYAETDYALLAVH
ncbi:MAG: hypothetical protein KC503_00955 [Myxococcales bacterium]|nr:hypothetical protein [Myxococcales bacterium]